MKTSDLLKYYNQDEILEDVMRICQNREVIPKFKNGGFGTRPSILMYKNDLLNSIRRGAVSFHISEEQWRNPLSLNQANSKRDMDELRSGWDLVLDIDTKFLEYAKVCTTLICHALDFHSIKNYSVKYSGGTGFHIAVPFQTFPEQINGIKTTLLFPSAPQKIAMYLRQMIKDKLADYILEIDSIERICEKTGKDSSNFIQNDNLNPFSLIEIDTIAISPRHLFRMPYSINEKKNLVSLPLKLKEISNFDPKSATIKKAGFTHSFLDTKHCKKNEAKELFVQAFDWHNKLLLKQEQDKSKSLKKKTWTKTFDKVLPEHYPPCIKKILLGLEDGKKRALFILINYLKSANYSDEEIEIIIAEWNKRNPDPLRESYIKGQLTWTKNRSGSYLPPNCNNSMHYSDLGICNKDDICKNIKNPLNYSFHKRKRNN